MANPGQQPRRRRERIFVDTNVFLRFLTGDDPEKAQRCRALFERAEQGQAEVLINVLVLAELAWTLRSYYGRPREEIASILEQLLDMRSVRIPNKATLQEAVGLYARHNVDFIDACHAVEARRRGAQRFYSYDDDFDRLEVGREEP